MSEFFRNFSMEALSRDDDRIDIKFDAIEELNKNIKNYFRMMLIETAI